MNVVPPPGDGEREKYVPRNRRSLDWRQAAPRWLMALALLAAAGWIGHLSARLSDADARALANLQAAVADAPTKFQARQAERVAVLEEQVTSLHASVVGLTTEMKDGRAATAALTTEVRLLTSEVHRMNAYNRKAAVDGGGSK